MNYARYLKKGDYILQPLSHQLAKHSCWVACMLNGIRCLLEQDRLATPVYRIVHSLLQDRGVVYYKKRDLEALKQVYWRLKKYTGLTFKPYRGEDVEPTLKRLELKGDQVAICDVWNGDHSILFTGRKGVWLRAFDPWWYDNRNPDEKIVQVVENWYVNHANTEILQDHLLDEDFQAHKTQYELGQAYPMGPDLKTRFMTVIRRRTQRP